MEYKYKVLEEVLISVGKDFSDENINKQLARLTSDELRKLGRLFNAAETYYYDEVAEQKMYEQSAA